MGWFRGRKPPTCRLDRAAKVRIFSEFSKESCAVGVGHCGSPTFNAPSFIKAVDSMNFSENWLRFSKVEDEYFICRYNLMQGKEALADDLKLALLHPHHRETALRLLVDCKVEIAVVLPLLSSIADTAIDSGNMNAIALAREVLLEYKDDVQARDIVRNTATTYLADNDEWHFRRTAELYELLGYEAELASLLVLCQLSSDSDIQEISKEY